ncbi:MAG TPA: hypothetical protein VH395_00155 [Jatrophihabitantaceae bacterium]
MTTTDTSHQCPGPGCTARVPQHMLACRRHWYQVSRATRARVWEAYRTGSEDHGDAILQAVAEMHK